MVANQTTREYVKCYIDLHTMALFFQGADGPNQTYSFSTALVGLINHFN